MNTEIINKVMNEQHGFFRSEDVDALVADTPDMQVLIRTGANRYTCRMDQIEEAIEEIEDDNDYVRDVCLTSDNFGMIKNGKNYIKATKIIRIHPKYSKQT